MFSGPNIGGLKKIIGVLLVLKVIYRRFSNFESSAKTVFSTFLWGKKALVASHFFQSKYRRFGPKRASFIWIIGDLLSPYDKYRNENYICHQGRNQAPIIYGVLFIVFLLFFPNFEFSENIGSQLLPYITI